MTYWILLPFRAARLGLYVLFYVAGHGLMMLPLLALAWMAAATQPAPFPVFITGGIMFFALNRFARVVAKWLAPRESWTRFRLPKAAREAKPQLVVAVRAKAPRGSSPSEKEMWRRLPGYLQTLAST